MIIIMNDLYQVVLNLSEVYFSKVQASKLQSMNSLLSNFYLRCIGAFIQILQDFSW